MQTILRSKTGVETIISPDAAVCRHRRAHQPHGAQGAGSRAAGRQFRPRGWRMRSAQVKAGAPALDVNAGLGVANAHELEPEVIVKAIAAVQSVVDVPLSIDSSVVGALRAGPGRGRQAAHQLRHRRERTDGGRLPARRGVQVRGDRHLQRRDRHQHGPGCALRGRQEDRPARRVVRHPARGHPDRPAGDAGGCGARLRRRGRPPGAPHRRRAGV